MRHVRQLCILIFTHILMPRCAYVSTLCIISLYVQPAKLYSRAREFSLFWFLSVSSVHTIRPMCLPSYIINVKLLFDYRIWKYVSELHDSYMEKNELQLFIIIRLSAMAFVLVVVRFLPSFSNYFLLE